MLRKLTLLVLGLLVAAYLCDANRDVQNCKYTDPATGKQYDLSPLIASNGSYTWNASVYSIGGFSLDSLVADDRVSLSFQLQICQNIKVPKFPNCTGNSSIYTYDSDNGCIAWGDAEVSAFSANPFKDGINWRLYHGGTIDHVSNYAAHVYFVCNHDVHMSPPAFEHVKAGINQAHFKIFTSLVC